ncbi:choline dehydrogenase [Rhizobium sp. NZLR11]|uniref:choline dehydrogenase n=1 Tax=Rhizobium sp. NZLR11 TaxID=2731098 RepID=UPI001C832CCE|nr:choline dehydrogenase [Rhizobium sp. NZLR11]MBX5210527.1 choline dehydrogenase [Rhizobium sp. NZLR11]
MGEMHYDHIIVGGGSAGCVLANRLSANPSTSVLLIEAGGTHKKWRVDMPAALDAFMGPCDENWGFRTDPEPGLQGRQIDHPRGRLLGGSSSINGMAYTRGNVMDFENWAARHGCIGWDYQNILPYFARSEHSVNQHGPGRGRDGPQYTRAPNPFADEVNTAFMNAGVESGFDYLNDSNGTVQEGFAPNEQTIYRGRRWSTARGYLDPVRDRPNLTVLTRCVVDRLLFDGKTAKAVVFKQQGHTLTAKADGEIILSAGTFGSAAILQRSGVGPKDLIERLGIPLVADLPVGENLQDHPDVIIQFKASRDVGIYRSTRGLARIKTGIEWFLTKTGPAATNHFEAAAYLKTDPTRDYPNIKLEMLPIAFEPHSFTPRNYPAFQVHMTLQRARSRGRCQINSRNPDETLSILFNYLEDEDDIRALTDAVRLMRRIAEAPAFKNVLSTEIFPGPGCTSDSQIETWLRANVNTAYHPGGTCKMGSEERAGTVVTPDLRVRGLSNLRVADASVMPEIVTANLNAATIAIGEKAAAIVLNENCNEPATPLEQG